MEKNICSNDYKLYFQFQNNLCLISWPNDELYNNESKTQQWLIKGEIELQKQNNV